MMTLAIPPLSALIHEEKLSGGSPVWVALGSELGVASQGFNAHAAREMLLETVEGFLENVLPTKIKACLADAR